MGRTCPKATPLTETTELAATLAQLTKISRYSPCFWPSASASSGQEQQNSESRPWLAAALGQAAMSVRSAELSELGVQSTAPQSSCFQRDSLETWLDSVGLFACLTSSVKHVGRACRTGPRWPGGLRPGSRSAQTRSNETRHLWEAVGTMVQ